MKTIICFMSLTLAVIFLAGCTTSRLETDYGTSYKLARFNQTLDLEAEKNLKPVEGIDGQVSQRIVDRYYQGFEKPAPAVPSVVLGVGGGK
ncbi:MAG: putative exported protein [Deltaproteobacteria bacterium]|nr:putative exported protein [Deltaproteobacteria bacterium]